MKTHAVVATAYGGPEVLSLIEVPLGTVGPGEALVEVRAVGTNPFDYKLYSGELGKDPRKLPMRLGFEASGVVREVAEGANGPSGPIRKRDEVVAYQAPGAYAEQIVVPAASIVPKPLTFSFEQASGMMVTGTTAVHALTVGRVKTGDTVLIHGASGGVGQMVVQLAAVLGAHVIGTASERNHALLRELGAEPVSYGTGLGARIRVLAPKGVDAAIDIVGSDEALEASLSVVKERDRIVTLLPSPRSLASGIKGIGVGGDPGNEIRNAARLELVSLANQGKVRVLVAETYPLAEAAAAHRALATGHSRGKIVLVP